MAEDIDLGNGMMLRQLPEGSYTYPKELPTEQTTLDSDPFVAAAARMRRAVVHDRPITEYQAPTNKPYIVEPDLVEAQQGSQELPTGYRLNDLNIPYNIQTGKEDLPVVRRPNVLPVTMTPNGARWAMPKMLDVVSNIMGGIGAPAVATKAGEVVLGSGAVKTAVQLAQDAKLKLTPVEGNPFAQPWDVKGFEGADWFHGTTHEFDKFKLAKGNPENHLGQYPHFTTAPEDAAVNYAGKGPDLTARIENRAEQIFDKVRDKYPNGEVGDDYGKVMTAAKNQATKELAGPHEGAIIPAKMKMQNPASLIDSKPTWIDFNQKWDKAGEEVIAESKNITKLLNSLKKQGEKYGFDGQKVFEEVAEKAYLYNGDVKASDLDKALRESNHMLDAANNKGNLVSSHVISNVFKDLGFDGIVMDAKSAFPHMKNIPEGTLHAVPLKQNTVKGKYNDKILYSDTRNQVVGKIGHDLEKGPFYSALERAVGDAKLGKASADQWLGYLKNQPGVKSEEINTVLKDLPQGQISKEALADIVKQNKVELKEVVKGEFSTADLDKAAVKARETGDWAEYDRLLNQAKSNETSNTKYHSYQLPGGENYKEILLTLPENTKAMADLRGKMATELRQKYGDNFSDHWTDAEKQAYWDTSKNNSYKSSHWPDEVNPVAHIRHNDRNIPVPFTDVEKAALAQHEAAAPKFVELKNQQAEVAKEIGKAAKPLEQARKDKLMEAYRNKTMSGPDVNKALEQYGDFPQLKPLQDKLDKLRKQEDDLRKSLPVKPEAKTSKTLHLEEWQSDLHQAGRDRGYVGEKEKLQPEFDKIENKLMATNDEKLLGQPTVKGVLKDAVEKKIITQDEANTYKRFTDIENQTPVPDLPFKKNWEELALKKALHKAATEGYEGLSWTPGEAQALRYQNDVRTKLRSVDWHDKNMGKVDPEGNKQILVTPAHGSGIELTVDKHGEIIKGHPELKGKNLDSVLGKDIARQVLEKSEGNVDAKNYVMNSEGMKAAYDKRGPDILNNIAKKYGSKVEQRDLPVTKMQIHDLRKNKDNVVPDDIAQSQYKSDWDKLVDKRKELQPLIDDIKRKLSDTEYLKVQKDWTNVNSRMDDLHNKMVEDTLVRKEKELKGQPIHYLPITPELRAKAKGGFPLFSQVPVTVPVQGNPFTDDTKKRNYTLVPVPHNPFGN